jgi:hypothetical protein
MILFAYQCIVEEGGCRFSAVFMLISSFLGQKRIDAISQDLKKLSISRALPPPTCPRNVSARIKTITRGVV